MIFRCKIVFGACAAVALGLALCPSAMAGDDPAVSAPTLSIDGSGGSVNGSPSGFASATGTLPLSHRFGFQLDGAAGKSGDQVQKGVGGHVFWRDPDQALLGAAAGWSHIGSANIYRYGLESEAYLGDFTLSPSFGLQRGDANEGTTSSGYGTLSLGWYVNSDFKLSLGGTGYSNTRIGFGEVEWQPYVSAPVAFFANGGGGNRGHGFAIAGIRYTFGAGEASLKDRERHGDPENIVSQSNPSGGNSSTLVAQVEKPRAIPVATPKAIASSSTSSASSSNAAETTRANTSSRANTSYGAGTQLVRQQRPLPLLTSPLSITPPSSVIATPGHTTGLLPSDVIATPGPFTGTPASDVIPVAGPVTGALPSGAVPVIRP